MDIFHPERGPKLEFLSTYPPHLVHVVYERPLKRNRHSGDEKWCLCLMPDPSVYHTCKWPKVRGNLRPKHQLFMFCFSLIVHHTEQKVFFLFQIFNWIFVSSKMRSKFGSHAWTINRWIGHRHKLSMSFFYTIWCKQFRPVNSGGAGGVMVPPYLGKSVQPYLK